MSDEFSASRSTVVDAVRLGRDRLQLSDAPPAKALTWWLEYYELKLEFGQTRLPVSSLLDLIGRVTTETSSFTIPPDWPSGYQLSPPSAEAIEWGKAFCAQVFREIRNRVCSSSDTCAAHEGVAATAKQNYPKALVVAGTSAVMHTLGISDAMAVGLATLVMLVVVESTKEAFCKMTDQDVLEAIRLRASEQHRTS